MRVRKRIAPLWENGFLGTEFFKVVEKGFYFMVARPGNPLGDEGVQKISAAQITRVRIAVENAALNVAQGFMLGDRLGQIADESMSGLRAGDTGNLNIEARSLTASNKAIEIAAAVARQEVNWGAMTPQQQEQRIAAILAQGGQLPHHLQHASLRDSDGSSPRSTGLGDGGLAGYRSPSAAYEQGVTSGHYTASNLPSSLRGLGEPGNVASTANYVSGLGLNPNTYTSYFVGASQHARDAIREHIQNPGGRKLTNDDVKSEKDVGAYIAAIKSGKLKEENAPQSVRDIMKDMKAKGIDPVTSDPSKIQKYFKDNPKALEDATKANNKELSAKTGATQETLNKETETITGKKTPPTTSEPSKLNETPAQPSGKATAQAPQTVKMQLTPNG